MQIFSICIKTYYLTKNQREKMQLQGIQPENGLKARVKRKNADGTDLTLSTAEYALKKTLRKQVYDSS